MRPKHPDPLEATRRYYDEFALRYDDRRGGRVPGGYHDLIDDLELGFLQRYARGRSVLEVGCGTGLLLSRIADFAARAEGVDLSPGMLAHARERGLVVEEGSATALPYPDGSFDVVCSFKVLAHIENIEQALAEMARVSRRWVVAEFYNRHSLRGLVKRLGPAAKIGNRTRESAVFTRFDTPADTRRHLPPSLDVVDVRGIRVFTPAAPALRIPGLGPILRDLETRYCDSSLARFGGFYVVAAVKNDRTPPETPPGR